jgi:hypothetical protein
VGAGLFWTLWGVAVGGIEGGLPSGVFAPAVVVGMLILLVFYATLFDVWRPDTGLSGWRVLLVPSWRAARARQRAIMSLLRPAWLRYAVRVTGWPTLTVTAGLAFLLAADLVLFGVLLVHPPSHGS